MAEIKWIKADTKMFSNRKIRQIECLPDGDSIIVIWMKLLMLAGEINDSGLIYFTRDIPYTEKTLATQLNRPTELVEYSLDIFEQFGMIEYIDGLLHISNWEKYQNVMGMEKIREQNRLRQQRKRERERQIIAGYKCVYCGDVGDSVDHIVPRSKGGDDSDDNKVRACLACNMQKTNRPLEVFLNEIMLTSPKFELGRILENEKLMRHVTFDDDTSLFVSRDVTQQNKNKSKNKI